MGYSNMMNGSGMQVGGWMVGYGGYSGPILLAVVVGVVVVGVVVWAIIKNRK